MPWELQRRLARDRLALELDEIGGGHLPMLSRPVELARRFPELWAEEPSRRALPRGVKQGNPRPD